MALQCQAVTWRVSSLGNVTVKYKNPNSVNLLYDLNTTKNDLTSMSEVNALVGRKTPFNINLRYFTIKPGHPIQPM